MSLVCITGDYYRTIDDYRENTATSIKTYGPNSRVYQRTLDGITADVKEMSDKGPNGRCLLQPQVPDNIRNALGGDKPVSQTKTRMLVAGIPENHEWLLRKESFVNALMRLHDEEEVIIHVVPVRGWRK